MFKVLAGLVCLLAIATLANASITGVNLASDGDGAIICDTAWDQAELVNVIGNQYWGPGHIEGTILASSPADPNLILHNVIDNDTTFAWTSYQVNVYLPVDFSVSTIIAYDPAGSSGALVQAPTYGTWDIDGTSVDAYKATILYTPGTPVAVGGAFEYRYKLTFEGATSYQFTQEMIPLPEPATMALLALGGLAMLKRRK